MWFGDFLIYVYGDSYWLLQFRMNKADVANIYDTLCPIIV
jgi:hypothetical protein